MCAVGLQKPRTLSAYSELAAHYRVVALTSRLLQRSKKNWLPVCNFTDSLVSLCIVMAAKNNDFLLWDDLPLEFLLGEFTESDEGLSEESSDSTDEDNLVENRGRKNTKRPTSDQENKATAEDAPARKKTRYQCPDCSKGYLSISGFRGHMTKKHSKPSTRAIEHRVGSISPMKTKTNENPGMDADCEGNMTEDELCEILEAAIKQDLVFISLWLFGVPVS